MAASSILPSTGSARASLAGGHCPEQRTLEAGEPRVELPSPGGGRRPAQCLPAGPRQARPGLTFHQCLEDDCVQLLQALCSKSCTVSRCPEWNHDGL